MSRRLLLGTFANEQDLLAVTTAVHARGYPIVDAYTPYPIHGLDKAMGLKPSRSFDRPSNVTCSIAVYY